MSRALVAQDDVRRLVDEQAALRRVATLVAEGATAADLFSGVAREVSEVLGVPTVTVSHYEPDRSFTVIASTNNPGFPVGSRWPMDGPSLAATIHDTGRAARIDEYSNLPGVVAAAVRDSSIRSAVGAPIVVDGSVWGHISVAATDPVPLPTDTERRLRDFTELVETAISNAEARDDLRRLADEQAALQRVATLVLDGAAANELFAAVAEEVARVLEVSSVGVSRFEPDGTSEVVGSLNDPGFPVGSRWPVQGPSLNAAVFETGRPARIDRHADLPGPVAAASRVSGVESSIAAPIIVSGSVWGMISIGQRDRDDVLPAATDSRLAAFTELVATAIANAQAHDDVRRLADEQAALRRVATLVAEGAPPEALFAALGEEVARLLHVSSVTVDRYEADSSVVIASINDPGFPVGSRWPLDGPSLGKAVFETGRPARIGDYADLAGTIATAARSWNVSSAVGVPIIVDGEVWGVICVSTKTHGGVLPPETDARLAAFTELVATAISNAQARNDLRQLAEEQAALRRVATLVARGTYSEVVFDAVCAETGRVVGATSVNLARFTDDGFNLTMAGWSLRETHVPVGTRLPLAPDTIGDLIVRTTAPARKDSYDGGSSELATLVRKSGIRSAVAAPVIVEGRVWGALIAGTDGDELLPAGTELRLARFTELLATAISNASTRAELMASRARIIAAGDEARRKIERDLHDGAQQRLIGLGLDLQAVRATVPPDRRDTHAGLERIEHELVSLLDEVRELSRGLHPALLSRGGLRPALGALARKSRLRVDLSVDIDPRPPAPIEIGVYYTVSEALTNAAKHAAASRIAVTVTADADVLRARIEDDGVGGAESSTGSGLIGLVDRIEALGGRFELQSPPGVGTTISIEVPVGAQPVA
ncbi:MAG: GAF domain-containing sensor histidine kinase [Actinobacteria bacterium]|nr:MAG: GAF domain-containing sensor histidine kinase [Actinomycetota bacterium]